VPDSSFASIATLVPVAYALTAGALLLRPPARTDRVWTAGLAAAAAALLLTLTAAPALQGPRLVMLPLVTLLGGLTLRFSRRYLDGDPRPHRFVAWFLAVLAGATLVVTTGDLVVLALAWTFTSLALHQLLTVGSGRPATEMMAHKKFILSRLADVAILSGVAVMVRAGGSSDISELLAAAGARADLAAPFAWGAALLAAGVILRSAQLPFHGWLLQVMEAPTPVSALLHAGIVNIGAFVLLVLAPLIGRATGAQLMLITAGTVTAVLAALAMLAQANVKGSLAWSTCAQMGFVLVECGLGAWDLALLHLTAHALYKAHAFLSSGGTVVATRARPRSTGAPARWPLGIAAAAAMVALSILVVHGTGIPTTGTLVSGLILTLAIAPTLAHARFTGGWRALRPVLGVAVGLPALHAFWLLLLGPVAPAHGAMAVGPVVVGLTLLAFVALFVVTVTVTRAPAGALARALHPHAAAGFHLDALFTRLTFRLWPPHLTAPRRLTAPLPTLSISERAA